MSSREDSTRSRALRTLAGDLGTSEITIGVHRGQIMRKMGARSLPELVRTTDKLGIVHTSNLLNEPIIAPHSHCPYSLTRS